MSVRQQQQQQQQQWAIRFNAHMRAFAPQQ
jgi:hypothetical protein